MEAVAFSLLTNGAFEWRKSDFGIEQVSTSFGLRTKVVFVIVVKPFERLFSGHPRILNVLHGAHLVGATSETNEEELAALSRHCRNAKVALEIGSSQGVSAAVIARSIRADGRLFCVDPWPGGTEGRDPIFEIFKRHIKRTKTASKIRILRHFSAKVVDRLPAEFDFAFIDGDHTWTGIETDWAIVSRRMRDGGLVCLHDTAVPAEEPWRNIDSCRFYEAVIQSNPEFELLETVYSMRVLRKRI